MSLPDLCLLSFVFVPGDGDGVESAFPGGVCLVEVALLLWNKLSWPILHLAGAFFPLIGGAVVAEAHCTAMSVQGSSDGALSLVIYCSLGRNLWIKHQTPRNVFSV
jgi:hypothetical protein